MTTAAIEADSTVLIIRVSRDGMEVGVDQGYAKLDALLAAGQIAGTAEGSQA